MSYLFLQHYWWFLISLLGALLVFLLFVQGGNSLLFSLGKNEEERTLMINSTGRKWEFTFTTLVTFGGAFFASFPLFYSTSFGGAYWLWMIILFSFVLQAVSYEFQSKSGNLLGKRTYQYFLVFNGCLAPYLLGIVVASFFTGANFTVDKLNIVNEQMPVISTWSSDWHGIDLLANPWNQCLGFAVVFLSQMLGCLYFINNIQSDALQPGFRKQLMFCTTFFLLFFIPFILYILLSDGYVVNPETELVSMESYKYFNNLLAMPWVFALFLVGVLLVLWGVIYTVINSRFYRGIWFTGIGTVCTVLSLFLIAGYNNTAYYPSLTDMQSSLTLANSCSSYYTLKAMAWVSLLIPFVLAYIFYTWRIMDRKKIDTDELHDNEHIY